MRVLILSSVLILGLRGCCPDGMYPEISPDGQVICRAEPTPEPTPEPSPTPSPSPSPEPTPEATPTPTPMGTPEPEATPSASPTPTPAVPAPTPETVCGRQMPAEPVPVKAPPCPLGFVPVTVGDVPVCVAASACGWRSGRPGPSLRPNMRCDAEDLGTPIDDTSCWHWPERLGRGFSLRKGLLCEYDDPQAEQWCSDAYGRRVRGGTLISGPLGWSWHGWCPPQWAVPCAEPQPTPMPAATPAPSATPIPSPTPETCPAARIRLAAGISCHVGRNGKVVCRVDSTQGFGTAHGYPCDSGPNVQDRTRTNYQVNCLGRWCESPDTGPDALRLTFTASPGTVVGQEEGNAFTIRVEPSSPDFWVTACLAPGNVSRAGDVLKLLTNHCTRREWTCDSNWACKEAK